MIESDSARQVCLGVTALVFALIALRAFVSPDRMAAGLGYKLTAPNGFSEIYAVYVGVWLATALLGVVALFQVQVAILGDLLAAFVLAQLLGRLLAWRKWGFPTGNLLIMFYVEIVGGIILLLVRPSA